MALQITRMTARGPASYWRIAGRSQDRRPGGVAALIFDGWADEAAYKAGYQALGSEEVRLDASADGSIAEAYDETKALDGWDKASDI